MNDKTGNEIAKYSQNQVKLVEYNNSNPLTFQYPVNYISKPIMESDGTAAEYLYMTIITDQNYSIWCYNLFFCYWFISYE